MSNLTGRQLLLLLACAVLVGTVGLAIYGLVRGPGGGVAPTTSTQSAPTATTPERQVRSASLRERTLPRTDDPIEYARAVAVSLFDWDTSSGFLPTDYTAAVLADVDPSGEETPGLLGDVVTYLPTVEQWLDLGTMEVEQTIEIDDAYVPDSWTSAVEQAHGHLRPGTTAVTITGTRHRSGVWNGETAEASSPVSFTVFIACKPAFDRCHVLRLSQLDNPLR